ncbi:MAG: mechanosensitive ion channel family protein [Melioribacteraceae bacterium]|nr:mechanosensitive ion channel family protein [Melioribacteraceae bacterium]MCF8355710.1 mechanosensitive ion channel family protein [Melioribacteraceae bacterium]MCF8394440.1 mechanosensitive ion channel family protein [Melioribacteraceae bacterium]MCF8418574.1 mechanosensitive ion channel family protein [Melioribacteraceae bacterium]
MDINHLIENNTVRFFVTLVLILLIYFVRSIVNRIINSKVEKLRKKYILRQIYNYIFLLISISFISILWMNFVESFFTLLSIAVAAFIIVSKELILNVVAHGVIITRGLFEAGDRIQIGQFAGDVMETGPVFFTISEIGNWIDGDEATGRSIKIPNSMVLTNAVANYSRGLYLIWEELDFDLSVESNFQKAKKIALDQAEEVAYKFSERDIKEISNNYEEMMFTSKDPSVNTRLHDGVLKLSVRFPCKLYKRRSSAQELFERIYNEFKNSDDIKLIARVI